MTEEGMSRAEEERRSHVKAKMGISVIAVVASLMLFAGFVSALIVSSMDKFWVAISLPKPFLLSTIIIVLSSVTLYLALNYAKKGNQKLIKVFSSLTLFLALVFCYTQTKGWYQLVNEGKMWADKVFYSYGTYGKDFIILENGAPIEHDGNYYHINGEKLSEEKVNSLKDFAFQITGERRREELDNYHLDNYGNPYTIKKLSTDSTEEVVLEFKENKVYASNVVLEPNQQKDLFRFAFGIYREMPYFIIQGKYDEDFYLKLNNERLEFENKRFYYPERELTQGEVNAINKNIYQAGKNYEIKGGEIFEEGKKIDPNNFETYLDLNDGIQVHIKNGNWTQMRQELNDAQYSEFYQTSNVASSYIWVFTVVHVLHVLIGIILLSLVVSRSFKGYYNENNQLGLKATGIIWHFLGVLWVSLYLLLQYFH